jgi:hypothetical protein
MIALTNSSFLRAGTTFLDGGLGHNNPSKLAYDEVEEIHRGRVAGFPIKVMVNIGTGRKATEGTNIVYRNGSRKTEVGHDYQNLSERERGCFDYYRLDVQSGLQDMDMDEWKKDGSTLVTIAQHTMTYLASTVVQSDLARAARQLVDARIARERLWTADKKTVITQIWLSLWSCSDWARHITKTCRERRATN